MGKLLGIAALVLFGLGVGTAYADEFDDQGHRHKNCPPGYNWPNYECKEIDRLNWQNCKTLHLVAGCRPKPWLGESEEYSYEALHGGSSGSLSSAGSHTLKLTRDDDGQFLAPCHIGGYSFRCLLDTGAAGGDPTAMLILSINMAQDAGLDISHVRFDDTVTTGDGVKTASASVTIPRLSVGPFVMTDATIVIVAGHVDVPIVTGHFMQRYTVTMRGSTMTISSE